MNFHDKPIMERSSLIDIHDPVYIRCLGTYIWHTVDFCLAIKERHMNWSSHMCFNIPKLTSESLLEKAAHAPLDRDCVLKAHNEKCPGIISYTGQSMTQHAIVIFNLRQVCGLF